MATQQGTIKITRYTARLEQAMTVPSRDPAYVLSMHGEAVRGSIKHALFYFQASGHPNYGKGDVTPGFRIRVFLGFSDYENCIDLLRNEKPVFLDYSYESFGSPGSDPDGEEVEGKLKYYGFYVRREPTGEGE